MCVSKREIRPGLLGIVDHIDTINEVRSKLNPIFSLLTNQADQDKIDLLTNEELGELGWLLRDIVSEAFTAADGIYAIYCKEVAK